MMLFKTPHNMVVEAMEADSFPFRNPTLIMITKMWESVKTLMEYRGFTEYSPIWNNKKLHKLQFMGKIKEWENQGINRLAHLYKDST